MDTRNQTPLQAERSELLRALATIKPRHIERLETELRATRNKRAETAQRLHQVCISESNANALNVSSEMQKLESELAKFDRLITEQRRQLEQARVEWRATFMQTTKPLLEAGEPALLHAAALIEGAAELYAVHDRFVSENGLGTWGPSKSWRLKDLAVSIRKFGGER